MRMGIVRALIVAAAGLWLAGCNTTGTASNQIDLRTPGATASTAADRETTGSVSAMSARASAEPGRSGADDEIRLGKEQYRANDFIQAEIHFNRALEQDPKNVEALLGAAASLDRQSRFETADRAYEKAIAIAGRTPEILNNQGYSYLLRGDTKRARAMLVAAKREEPNNKFVLNNLKLIDESRKGKRLE